MQPTIEARLKSFTDALKQELSGVRANRPTPKLVEDIKVDYFGQQLPLKQLGAISVVPPREIQVNVWDKNALAAVVKAIETSGVGLTPNTEGTIIRLFLPTLTDERRAELEKLAKKTAEEYRIKIRAARDEANKKIEADFKAKTISEDQKFKQREQIQKEVDKANKEIENLLTGKIKEISE